MKETTPCSKKFVFGSHQDRHVNEKELNYVDDDFRKATGRSLFDDDIEIEDHSNVQSVVVTAEDAKKLNEFMGGEYYASIEDDD